MSGNWINWEDDRNIHTHHSFPRLVLHNELTAGGISRSSLLRAKLPECKDQLRRAQYGHSIPQLPTLHHAIASSRILGLRLSTVHEIRSEHRGMTTCMALDPLQARYLLTGGADGRVSCMDLGSLDEVSLRTGENYGVRTARVLHCTPAAAAGSQQALLSSVEWYAQDCGIFVTSDYAGRVHLWDTNTFGIAYTFDLSKGSLALAWGGETLPKTKARDGRGGATTINGYMGYSISSSNYTGQNNIYANSSPHNSIHTSTAVKVMCARVRSQEMDRAIVACALSDSSIKLCDTRTGDSCLTVRGHSQSVSCLQWSPKDAHQLYSGSYDGTVKAWDIRRIGGVGYMDDGTGGERHEPLLSFDWRGDHTTVATYFPRDDTFESDNHRMKRLRTDAQHEALGKAHDGSVMSMRFSSCGNYLVTAGTSSSNTGVTSNSRGGAESAHTLRLWDAQTGKLQPVNYNINGGNSYKLPYEMAIAPFNCGGDDLLLYPMGDSGDIGIVPLHASRGKILKTLQGHFANVTALLYRGSEYDQVISSSRDGMIYVWEAGPRSVSDALQRRAMHPLHGAIDIDLQPNMHATTTSIREIASARREVAIVGSSSAYGLEQEGGFLHNADFWD